LLFVVDEADDFLAEGLSGLRLIGLGKVEREVVVDPSTLLSNGTSWSFPPLPMYVPPACGWYPRERTWPSGVRIGQLANWLIVGSAVRAELV
jgi:hypothetical protein